MLGIYICLAIVVGLALILILPLGVEMRLHLSTSGDKAKLNILIQPVIRRLTRELTYEQIDLNIFNWLPYFKMREQIEGPDILQGMAGNKPPVPEILRKFQENKAYYIWGKRCLNYLIIEKLDWQTRLGFIDAMYTAMAAGGLWAIKGALISCLSSKSRLKRLNINVQPDFNNQYLDSQLYSILKMRIVHIIFIAGCFYIFNKKIKK